MEPQCHVGPSAPEDPNWAENTEVTIFCIGRKKKHPMLVPAQLGNAYVHLGDYRHVEYDLRSLHQTITETSQADGPLFEGAARLLQAWTRLQEHWAMQCQERREDLQRLISHPDLTRLAIGTFLYFWTRPISIANRGQTHDIGRFRIGISTLCGACFPVTFDNLTRSVTGKFHPLISSNGLPVDPVSQEYQHLGDLIADYNIPAAFDACLEFLRLQTPANRKRRPQLLTGWPHRR